MSTSQHNTLPAGPRLTILDRGKLLHYDLDHRQEWLLGRRDPAVENGGPEISLSSRLVSREHGWFFCVDGQWSYAENPKNLNGTFHKNKWIKKSPLGKRKPVRLSDGDVLRIDNDMLDHEDGVVILFTTCPMGTEWCEFSLEGRQTTVIGEALDCDLCHPGAGLAERHAKLTALNGSYYLSDCGSRDGTYHNDEPVSGPVILRDRDHIQLGRSHFFILGNSLLYC